ncbi:MAG TPA: GNAT family N-acetyltransferase [Candidatus Scalindua sp.]|nr:GNAT family N-acetyltransferase [Candidatus Scalindua sp.]
MDIEKAKVIDIDHVASLHREYINTGFLSSLGSPFLKLIYQSMVNSNNAFCIVAIEKKNIIGFVSGAIDIGGFYKDFLRRNFIKASTILLPKILNFQFAKKIIETLLYPARKEQNLPEAELLSIVVDKNYRGKGIARKLFEKLEEEFKTRSVNRFKVIVGSKLISARRFYEKMGGILHSEVEVHKGEKSNIYIYVYIWEI